jgi:hypothetical protein
MNVSVSYTHRDSTRALELSSALEDDGYNVFIDNKIPIGNNIYKDIGAGLAKADVAIVIISPNSNENSFVNNEIVSLLSFFEKGKMPLIIPIIIGKETIIPRELSRFNYIVIPFENKKDNEPNYTLHGFRQMNEELAKDAIEKVRIILAAHDDKLRKFKEEKKESEQKVKIGLSEYIDDVFVTLKQNEKRNKRFSYILYSASLMPLMFTLVYLGVFASRVDVSVIAAEQLLFMGIIVVLVIVILFSISKFLFSLAKAFMVESIRCSDRIHAISFGKFFLDAFGTVASHEEILRAFSSWNIDNGASSFRNQSGDDYDPKLLELLSLLKK